jgi:hypothetical protein
MARRGGQQLSGLGCGICSAYPHLVATVVDKIHANYRCKRNDMSIALPKRWREASFTTLYCDDVAVT